MSHTCNFCKRDFVKETTLQVHMCEPKRRHREKDEKGVQLGLQAYLRFYEVMQGSSKLKTFDDFVESAYYKAFVKFGRYCVAVKVINVARFTDWLLKHNKKIDHWCKDSVYEEYLLDYLKIENPTDAVARAIEQSLSWSEETGYPAHDYLRHGNTNGICHAIVTGRISAWALYNSASGNELLERLSSEQLEIVWPYIDTDHWSRRFQDYLADTEYVKEILKQAGW